jgi:hypothetical protein
LDKKGKLYFKKINSSYQELLERLTRVEAGPSPW